MGIFNKKESKYLADVDKFIDEHNLNGLSGKDLEDIRRIANNLYGTKLGRLSTAVSFSRVEEQLKISYLSTIIEQNWLIIKKLDEISKK